MGCAVLGAASLCTIWKGPTKHPATTMRSECEGVGLMGQRAGAPGFRWNAFPEFCSSLLHRVSKKLAHPARPWGNPRHRASFSEHARYTRKSEILIMGVWCGGCGLSGAHGRARHAGGNSFPWGCSRMATHMPNRFCEGVLGQPHTPRLFGVQNGPGQH